jgi:hypothetical protein
MGYFSNATEGDCYMEEFCSNCKNWVDKKDGRGHGCAIWDLHLNYNYELCNSKSKAKEILDWLIPRDKEKGGNSECIMFLKKTCVKQGVKENEMEPT